MNHPHGMTEAEASLFRRIAKTIKSVGNASGNVPTIVQIGGSPEAPFAGLVVVPSELFLMFFHLVSAVSYLPLPLGDLLKDYLKPSNLSEIQIGAIVDAYHEFTKNSGPPDGFPTSPVQ